MENDTRDIPITDLVVLSEDRESINQEVIDELKASISSQTMLHALTVVEDKRLYACTQLGHKTVQCLVLPKSTPPDKIKEISIHENLKRYNLPWWEVCEMERELHEMRQRQKGAGRPGSKVGWSLRDTAEELGKGFGTLSEDLRLAEAVMANPNLKKITDKITAKKLIFATANRLEAEMTANLPTKLEHNIVYHGDAAEVLKHLPPNSFDVCFTDPPWLEYKDDKLTKDLQTIEVFKEVYRVMKRDSFLYAIVSTPDFIVYLQELAAIGFKVQEMPLIWHKQNVVSHGLRSWEYTRDFEPILLAVKGSPTIVNSGKVSAVYSSPAVHPTKLIHPNEKPVDVPMHFLEHCSYEGSMILDPFGGSGVTAEACIRMKRRYVTIERDKKFADGIERRISALDQSKNSSSE